MSFQPSFSFGFSPIPNSKNKYFFYEIESTKGQPGLAITIKNNESRLISKYQYPKSLLNDKKIFFDYVWAKTENIFTQPDFSLWMPFFLLPPLYFLIFLIRKDSYVILNYLLILATVFYRETFDAREGSIILIILSLWIHLFTTYQIDERVLALISIGLIVISPFMPFSAETGYNDIADRFTILAYGFLIVLTAKLFYSLAFNRKNRISVKNYLLSLLGKHFSQWATYTILLLIWGIINVLHSLISVYFFCKNYVIFILSRFFLIFDRLKKNLVNISPKTGLTFFLAICKIILFVFFSLLSALIVFFIVIGIVTFSAKIFIQLDRKIRAENLRQLRFSLDPKIDLIEPGIVYHSTKVVIYGTGFDPKADNASLLKLLAPNIRNFPVTPDFKSDTKIIFTIPLDWNTGQLYFWVETPITWQGKYIMAKSNVVSVKLIPRISPYSPGFSPDDEAYFKQLETLREETLLLNGHTPVKK